MVNWFKTNELKKVISVVRRKLADQKHILLEKRTLQQST